ncbi:hypothetical protein F4677DRAFT_210074 [Hypoxylon crocopeplum]|nr:hypothetical protein F4677DRAFT_210074 [Hypoxylon crocopeplum]
MSQGVKSLWMARGCTVFANRLSLILRNQHNPPVFLRSSSPRWFSQLSTRDEEMEILPEVNRAKDQLQNKKTHSNILRSLRRRVIKKKSGFQPMETALVKQLVHYPNKRSLRRSLRKHKRSAARQHLYDDARDVDSNTPNDWRSTFDFMLRHTREIRETLNFRVIIGKGVAVEARQVLSEPDTHLSQIGQRNECLIRIENEIAQRGELVLSLSGFEDSVRESLLEIIGVVGKITAVRVSNWTWDSLLWGVWKEATAKQPDIRLLNPGEVTLDNKTITVQNFSSDTPKYKPYRLTKRADEITRPTEWTNVSFKEYVAALVLGRVPTHLSRTLYPSSPNHQETVVSLLVNLFTSEHTKPSASVSALKLAVDFIESRGSGFRRASRTIFNEVESLNMPMGAEIFNIFLVSAAKAGDLAGFNSILRSMVRKGHYVQSHAWIAFIELIEDPTIKSSIVEKLKDKGLTRSPSILREIGKRMAVIDLERQLLPKSDIQSRVNIRRYIEAQNKKYGTGWLDTLALNKIVDVLGAHDRLDVCDTLLGLVYTNQGPWPDVVTLNTILTHATTPPRQIQPLTIYCFERVGRHGHLTYFG